MVGHDDVVDKEAKAGKAEEESTEEKRPEFDCVLPCALMVELERNMFNAADVAAAMGAADAASA